MNDRVGGARAALRGALGVAVALVLAGVVLDLPGALGPRLSDLAQGLAGAAASAACLVAARGARRRWGWLLLGAGLGAWTCGHVLGAWGTVGGPPWTAAAADASWFLAAVVTLPAFLALRLDAPVERTAVLVGEAATVTLALFGVAWAGVLRPVLSTPALAVSEQALLAVFTLSHVAIAASAVLAAGRAVPGTARALGLAASGVMVMLVSDLAFVYLQTAGGYTSGNVLDVGWVAGCVLLAGAAGRPEARDAAWDASARRSSALLLSYLPVLVLFAVPPLTPDGTTEGGTVLPVVFTACLVLVAVRHGLTLAEERRTAAVLQATATELRASEALFRSLVVNSTGATLLCAADGTVLTALPDATALLGYAGAAVEGRPVTALVDPDDCATLRSAVAQWAARPGPGASVALAWRHADGTFLRGETAGTNLLDDPAVRAVVLTTQDVTERDALERLLRHESRHDPLTHLPNRRAFEEAVRGAGRSGAVGVVFVDLDGFKGVNDSLGHAVGDAVLVQVGERLAGAARPGDLPARLSGDEFALLVRGLRGERDAHAAARRVEAAFVRPFEVGDLEVTVRASIGVAVAGGDDRVGDALIRDADLAMYEAKAAGGGRVVPFGPALRAAATRRNQIEAALLEAASDGALTIDYQPIVALGSGHVEAVEALARLHHPLLGAIGPDEFIPIAERSGLVVPLGRTVLRRACTDVAGWRAGPGSAGLAVCVNLSVRQLEVPGLVEDVAAALRDAGLPPAALVLEITETVLMDHAASLRDRIAAVRRVGVRIALDDFGTGYSSLGYLRRLAVDHVKLDRSFIDGLATDARAAALVQGVLRMCEGVGARAIAEGIERPDDLAFLEAVGCHLGQGFLLSAPVPPGEVPALLQRRLPAHVVTSPGPSSMAGQGLEGSSVGRR